MVYLESLKQRLIRIPHLDLPTAINANYWLITTLNILYEIAMYVVMSDTKLIIYVNLYTYHWIKCHYHPPRPIVSYEWYIWLTRDWWRE